MDASHGGVSGGARRSCALEGHVTPLNGRGRRLGGSPAGVHHLEGRRESDARDDDATRSSVAALAVPAQKARKRSCRAPGVVRSHHPPWDRGTRRLQSTDRDGNARSKRNPGRPLFLTLAAWRWTASRQCEHPRFTGHAATRTPDSDETSSTHRGRKSAPPTHLDPRDASLRTVEGRNANALPQDRCFGGVGDWQFMALGLRLR